MARQFLRFTPETTYGTYNGSGTHTIIQIDQNNPFTMRRKPIDWTIRSAGGFNRRVQRGSQKTALNGSLSTLIYSSQAAALMTWSVATAANVLPSCTVDHVIVMDDGGLTKVYQRYLGVMVQQAQFSSSEQSQLARLSLTLVGQKTATITVTDFPEPAVTAYPSDAPYVFEMAGSGLSGLFTLGSARTEFEGFNLTIQNMLDPRFMASHYLTRCKYCGRDVSFTARFPYVTTVDRATYEAVTPVAAEVLLTNGVNSIDFVFNSQNYYADVQDDLALDKVHLQSITMDTFFDTSAGTPNDLLVTVV